jgi:hypothetical protein
MPTLLSLPVELRLDMYQHLFRSTTIRHGFSDPASCRTSILRTCRQIHNEAKPYLRNASFHFRSTVAMLDTLMTFSREQIEQIRCIRVKGFPFPLYEHEEAFMYTTYGFPYVLPLFPGLQLDRLIVEDPYHDEGVNDGWGDTGAYCDVDSLLESDGWRELEYISPTTDFLHPAGMAGAFNWEQLLRSRDGANSDAEVVIRRAKGPKVPGATEDGGNFIVYTASTKDDDASNAEAGADTDGDDEGEDDADRREVRVIVTRGKNADYVQREGKLHETIESVFDNMTWDEIKETGLYVPSEDDPCDYL